MFFVQDFGKKLTTSRGLCMTKITREEVLKIARISALEIPEQEIETVQKQLESVLSYAARVQEFSHEEHGPSVQNINILRSDVVQQLDAAEAESESILKRAPEREENFFVVPAILEDK